MFGSLIVAPQLSRMACPFVFCYSMVPSEPQSPKVFQLQTSCFFMTNHLLLEINFQPENPVYRGVLSGFTLLGKEKAKVATRKSVMLTCEWVVTSSQWVSSKACSLVDHREKLQGINANSGGEDSLWEGFLACPQPLSMYICKSLSRNQVSYVHHKRCKHCVSQKQEGRLKRNS